MPQLIVLEVVVKQLSPCHLESVMVDRTAAVENQLNANAGNVAKSARKLLNKIDTEAVCPITSMRTKKRRSRCYMS